MPIHISQLFHPAGIGWETGQPDSCFLSHTQRRFKQICVQSHWPKSDVHPDQNSDCSELATLRKASTSRAGQSMQPHRTCPDLSTAFHACERAGMILKQGCISTFSQKQDTIQLQSATSLSLLMCQHALTLGAMPKSYLPCLLTPCSPATTPQTLRCSH